MTMVAEAGNQVFDDKGVISLYLDGMLVYEENFTNRYMGVLRPQGFGGNGAVFDDLIWYTSGNNIPQTAPVIQYAWLTGLFGPSHAVEANYVYYDANGDFELPIAGTNRSSSLITWQSSVDGESGWTDISEESQENKSFVLPETAAGQYVRAKIVPVSSTQNYGVPNTARIGEAYYTEPNLISSHGNYTDLQLELSSKQLKVFGLLEGQTWSEIDLEKERVQFESLDNDFVHVSKDGIFTATRFGVVNIRVMVENPDGTVISKDFMLALGMDFYQKEGFEGWFGSPDGSDTFPFKSDDRAYHGNYSMKLTGTQSKDCL